MQYTLCEQCSIFARFYPGKLSIANNVEQAEAEVVPSSSSVQFKLESDLVCLRFIKFI